MTDYLRYVHTVPQLKNGNNPSSCSQSIGSSKMPYAALFMLIQQINGTVLPLKCSRVNTAEQADVTYIQQYRMHYGTGQYYTAFIRTLSY